MVHFTGDSFVLPATVRRGIPLVSVNTPSVNLKLYRIGDRGIAPLLTSSQFLTQIDGYSAATLADEAGELVWQGADRHAIGSQQGCRHRLSGRRGAARAQAWRLCTDRHAAERARPGVGRAGDAMVRRLRHRHLDLCRHGWAERLRPVACQRQAARRRRIAAAGEEQRNPRDSEDRRGWSRHLHRRADARHGGDDAGRHHRQERRQGLRLPRHDPRRLRPLRSRRYRPRGTRRHRSLRLDRARHLPRRRNRSCRGPCPRHRR